MSGHERCTCEFRGSTLSEPNGAPLDDVHLRLEAAKGLRLAAIVVCPAITKSIKSQEPSPRAWSTFLGPPFLFIWVEQGVLLGFDPWPEPRILFPLSFLCIAEIQKRPTPLQGDMAGFALNCWGVLMVHITWTLLAVTLQAHMQELLLVRICLIPG